MSYTGQTTPDEYSEACSVCGKGPGAHTDEKALECELQFCLNDTPKEGLRFLALGGDGWEWVDLDGIAGVKKLQFVKMAVKDGEILEDLG